MDERAVGVTKNEYDRLVEAHRSGLQRMAVRIAGNRDDAEDLLQESLVDAYRSFHTFHPGTRFPSWLARIMTNNHLDRVRRRRLPTISLDCPDVEGHAREVADPGGDPSEILTRDGLDQPLSEALGRLQPQQRAAVELCDLAGATYQEAADVQGCPIGTIRSRISRAHTALREFLSTWPGFPTGAPVDPAPMQQSRRGFLRAGTAAAFASISPSEARGSSRTRILVLAGEPLNWLGDLGAGLQLMIRAPRQGLAPQLGRAGAVVWDDQLSLSPSDRRELVSAVRDRGLGLVILTRRTENEVIQELLQAGSWEKLPAQERAWKLTAPRHPLAAGVAGTSRYTGEARGRWFGIRPDHVVATAVGSEGDGWHALTWSFQFGRVVVLNHSSTLAADEAQRLLVTNAMSWVTRIPAANS